MATKKKARTVPQAAAVSLPQAQAVIDLGRKKAVTVRRASAEALVFTLDDGTELHLKPVLMGIERSLEKYNATGDPIYQFQVGLMINPVVPKKLKRKVKA